VTKLERPRMIETHLYLDEDVHQRARALALHLRVPLGVLLRDALDELLTRHEGALTAAEKVAHDAAVQKVCREDRVLEVLAGCPLCPVCDLPNEGSHHHSKEEVDAAVARFEGRVEQARA